MKRKIGITLIALLLTALLFRAMPWKTPPEITDRAVPILRIWVTEEDGAAFRWLQKQAGAYEKASGRRVYLRRAGRAEADATLSSAPGAVIPDMIVGEEGDTAAALRGYALILRDDTASRTTPRPTSALFFRPSPAPGPTAPPVAMPPWERIGAVLAAQKLMGAVPGTVASLSPAADLAAGKADAALLTAGEAAGLQAGFRAFPVPQGRGLLPIMARALTADGDAFLAFLLAGPAQAALGQVGLYALSMRLYGPDDPIRFMIDGNREMP